MAIHTEYSVRVNSAYAPTTRRSALLPASAPNAPRRPRLATANYVIAQRRPVNRTPTGPLPHVPLRIITGDAISLRHKDPIGYSGMAPLAAVSRLACSQAPQAGPRVLPPA